MRVCFVVIICSKSAENVSVTEGEAVNITINCSGYFDFDFTLFLNTTAGSAQGLCLCTFTKDNLNYIVFHLTLLLANMQMMWILSLTHTRWYSVLVNSPSAWLSILSMTKIVSKMNFSNWSSLEVICHQRSRLIQMIVTLSSKTMTATPPVCICL